VVEHLTLRELMVRTVPENGEFTLSNPQVLPAPIRWQDAVHILLAMKIPLR
jgi:hypothetical protein